jgi:UDP-2,3-diacylglucosamine hydrolase
MHGDQLCTDDHAFQAFRALSRTPQWQAGMLALPLHERRALALKARDDSQAYQAEHSHITDVNESTVKQIMQQHGWPTLIHGHTHRPTTHLMNTLTGYHLRIVLPDWRIDGTMGYGELTADGFELVELEFDTASDEPAVADH